MLRILLAISNDKARSSFEMVLDNCPFNVSVVESASLRSSMEKFDSKGPFDLVLMLHHPEKMNAEDFYIFAKEKSDRTAFFIISDESLDSYVGLSSFKTDHKFNTVLPLSTSTGQLTAKIGEVFQDKTNLNFTYEEVDYKKIRTSYFLRFNKTLCDVFVQLSDTKYVKILKRGDIYARNDIKKWSDKKMKFLYIENEDFEDFKEEFARTPFLVMDKDLTPETSEEASLAAIEIVHELVKEIGVSEEVVNLVDYTVFQMEENLKKGSPLEDLLTKMRNRKDYLNDHSYMVAYICGQISDRMSWDSEEIKKKLAVASILHDITLDNPELAMAVDLGLPELQRFPKEEVTAYKQHPYEVAQLVRDSDSEDIPPNVDEIVLNHHENPEASGFPKGIDADRISALSAVFIVAHAFVNEMYRVDFDKSKMLGVIFHLKKRFAVGQYLNAMTGLVESVDPMLDIINKPN
ncbi:MAG: HD domain-containing protein [Bacteriovoracaceae bacterium]|nr:HD domain-containing protein [Bacteriovoracaceae bacterium]